MKIDPRIAMTLRQIMLMNFGFFGIQYSFGLQQTAITPVFSFLNADPGSIPLLHLGKRPRAAAALFFNRRHRLQPVPVSLPARYRLVDGRAAAVDA